jgi:hypothetical protein
MRRRVSSKRASTSCYVPTRTRVAVQNAGHVHQLLSSRRRNQTGTTGCRNETHADGSTLASDLARATSEMEIRMERVRRPLFDLKSTSCRPSTLFFRLYSHSMRKSLLTPPVSSTDRRHIELGGRNRSTNSIGDFTAALDSESNVTIGVSNGHESLETRALTSGTLFL